MSLIFSESFEQNSSGALSFDKWNLSTPGGAVTGSARTGTYAWRGAATGKRRLRASEEHATLIVGLALMLTGAPATGQQILSLWSDSGATNHVYVQTNASDATKLDVCRGDGTVLVSTATGALPHDSVYRYYELKATLSDTVGAVTLRCDETIVASASGVDTKNGGTKTVFDSFSAIVLNTSMFADDLYLCNGAGSVNNDFLGAIKVEALQPNGNGAHSGMTNDVGNSTNNYSHVNDALATAPVTTTYVEGDTTQDTYTFGDSLLPSGNAVAGVTVWAYAQKSDAGARALNMTARLSSTDSNVASTPADTQSVSGLVNGVYHWQNAIYETKPGGGAWTVADVNNAEFGYQGA